ncbi:neutral/alkaline non-lysosomal ceramidase N-terminal domain-containing protein [bacterium]|nr:neutral/alkaline non-lysosomal ceramidase N-terminal domain-containing protein [bacterium]
MEKRDSENEIGTETSRRGFLVGSMASILAAGFFDKISFKKSEPKPAGIEPPAKPGEPTFRIGAAAADITPTKSMNMSGYGTRNKKSVGTYQPLHVKALTIDDGRRPVLFLAADIVEWDGMSQTNGMAARLRNVLREKYGLEPDQFVMNAAHNHCGPALKDPEYNNQLVEKVVDVVGRALKSAREGRLYFGRTHCDFAVNRRSMDMQGNYIWQVINRYGPHDHEVIVLKAVDMQGKPIAVAFNYGCHPITMGGYRFGGDYVGFAMEAIEKEIPGATALFLQGCEGDTRPDCPDPNNPLIFRSSLIEVDAPDPARPAGFGRKLAAAVIERLRAPMEPVSGEIHTGFTTYQLPMLSNVKPDKKKPDWGPTTFATGDWTNENAGRPEWTGYMRDPERRWMRLAEILRDSVNADGSYKITQKAEMIVTRIGDKFVHVGISGEPTSGIGLRIKDQLRGNQVLVTACNGPSNGYVPTAAQIVEGGYEVFHNSRNIPYSLEAEDVLVNQAMAMVEEMRHE